ncbi:MAG: hypothetical protein ABF295_10645 [Flavobacteriaceae bacterium]
MYWKLTINAILGSILLHLIYVVISWLTDVPGNHILDGWVFLANFLVALILGFYIMKSRLKRWQLMLGVFLIYFIIGHFNLLIEAYIFNITDRGETISELYRGLMVALVFSPLYVLVFRSILKANTTGKMKFQSRNTGGWIWRILLGDIMYLFFYIGAGLILSIARPDIMNFYDGKLPDFPLMIQTQIYLRGFLFVGVAILILRTMTGSRLRNAIFIGLVFAVIGAIAPLIPANDLMPGYVRWGHGIEVSTSNFIYGLLLGLLLGQTPEQAGVEKRIEQN